MHQQVALLLFLVLESPFAGVASAISLSAGNDTGVLQVPYGEKGTPGFTAFNTEFREHPEILEICFKYLVIALLPFMTLLFYNKIVESYSMNLNVRGKCKPSSIQVQGYEELFLFYDVDHDVPSVFSMFGNVLMVDTKAKEGHLVPFPANGMTQEYDHAFGVSRVVDDPQELLQPGDVLIGVNCKPVTVKVGETPQTVLDDMLQEIRSIEWNEVRLPLILTALRPTEGPLCPHYMYLPPGKNFCCAIRDDECKDKKYQLPLVSRATYIEIITSRTLTKLTMEKRISAGLNLNKKISHANDPLLKYERWEIQATVSWAMTILKFTVVYLVTCALTVLAVYIPMHVPDTAKWRNIAIFAVIIVAIAAFGIWIWTIKTGVQSNMNHVDMLASVLGLWLVVVLTPGAFFTNLRGQSANSHHVQQFSFTFITSFLGIIFTSLYLLNSVLNVGKTRFHLPVPSLLTEHIGDLVFATGAFLEGIGGFRELSRTAYANGGACNLNNLNSELVKIKRKGRPVRWACEENNFETLDVEVADGTTCNVMCSPTYIKPVTCYDYGLIGGEWTLLHLNLTEQFCCHPFACDPDTQVFNASRCNLEDDGCMPVS